AGARGAGRGDARAAGRPAPDPRRPPRPSQRASRASAVRDAIPPPHLSGGGVVRGSAQSKETRSVRAKSRTQPERSRGRASLGFARQGVSTSLDTNGLWDVLASVPDPEIPVLSVIDLGIVRAVEPDRVVIT